MSNGYRDSNSEMDTGDNTVKKRDWKKTLIALVTFITIIVLPVGIVMSVSRRLNIGDDANIDVTRSGDDQIGHGIDDTDRVSKKRDDSKVISAAVGVVKQQISNNDIPLRVVEESIWNLESRYGTTIDGLPELRQLLKVRREKEAADIAAEQAIVGDAERLKARLSNANISSSIVENELKSFIEKHGADRSEISELQELLAKKVQDEEDKHITETALGLLARLSADDEELESVEIDIAAFVIEHGESRKEVGELRRLIEKRKERERAAAAKESLIESKVNDIIANLGNDKISIQSLDAAVTDFVLKYGSEREDSKELVRVLRQRQAAEKQTTERDNRIKSEAKNLMSQISKDDVLTGDMERAVSEFIVSYGPDRVESGELQRLLAKRQEHDKKAVEHTSLMQNETRSLIDEIGDPEVPISEVERNVTKFIVRFGEDQKEAQELIRLLTQRRKDETTVMESTAKLIQEARELAEKISQPKNSIVDIENEVSKFALRYGSDRPEVIEVKRLTTERRSREESKKKDEAELRNVALNLLERINKSTDSIEKMETGIEGFIIRYGEDRREIIELRKALDRRIEREKAITMKKQAETDKYIAGQALGLRVRLTAENADLESLGIDIDKLAIEHGEARGEVLELRRLVEQLREKEYSKKTSAPNLPTQTEGPGLSDDNLNEKDETEIRNAVPEGIK